MVDVAERTEAGRPWPARPRRARARLAGVLLLAALTPTWVGAQQDAAPVLERRAKAALLYRFVDYIDWPASVFSKPESPFTIGIIGADVLAVEFAEFAAGHSVLMRQLVVRRLRPAEPVQDVQMLFVGRDAAVQLGEILRSAPAHALIVTDFENALQQGSVINFVVVDGTVRFAISLESARQRGIRLSSRLLSAAHAVHSDGP